MYNFNASPSNDFLQRMKMAQMGPQNPSMGMAGIGGGMPQASVPIMGSGDANSYAMPSQMPSPMIDTGPSGMGNSQSGFQQFLNQIMGRNKPPQQGMQTAVQPKPMSMAGRMSTDRPGIMGKYNNIAQSLGQMGANYLLNSD